MSNVANMPNLIKLSIKSKITCPWKRQQWLQTDWGEVIKPCATFPYSAEMDGLRWRGLSLSSKLKTILSKRIVIMVIWPHSAPYGLNGIRIKCRWESAPVGRRLKGTNLKEPQPRPSQAHHHRNLCQWRRRRGSSRHGSVRNLVPKTSPLQYWQIGKD